MLSIKDTGIAALMAIGVFGPRTFASIYTTLPIPELVDFGDNCVVDGLYRPSTTGPKSRIAVYVMPSETIYPSPPVPSYPNVASRPSVQTTMPARADTCRISTSKA
jgi:hypothetical protein